jgi:hypothetical protein
MNKNQNIAALKKSVASLTESRESFLSKLGEVTGKLNSANSELATLMGAPAPQMLRVAGMSKSAAQPKGENENKWIAKYGKRCRLQDKTIKTFNLSGDRESMIGQFAKLRESNKAILTVTGWKSSMASAPVKVNAAKQPAKSAAKPKKMEKVIKQNKKAAPAKVKATMKKAAPAKVKAKVAKPAAKVSAKAAALAAEIAKDKRPMPASQVAIMG